MRFNDQEDLRKFLEDLGELYVPYCAGLWDLGLVRSTEDLAVAPEADLQRCGVQNGIHIARIKAAASDPASSNAQAGPDIGATGASNKGSHKGKRSAEGSPEGPAHKAPKRSIAFGGSERLLKHYCPKIVMRTFDEGMPDLLKLAAKQPGTFSIKPRDYEIPQAVLNYLLPQLQKRLLGSDICSENEASSVLKTYEMIQLLVRCCPWTEPAKAAAKLMEPEQDKLEVMEGEASSLVFSEQKIAHETWQREPGFVKGRIELQIVCSRPDGTKYHLGACEMAGDLSSPELLNAKLQQVAKEAFAFAVKNARAGYDSMPVKMLLSDGRRFMRVNLQLNTKYEEDMDLHKLAGNFSFSAAYPILWQPGTIKADSYDAVRLLLSWMWDGTWQDLRVDQLVKALEAADERDARELATMDRLYAAVEEAP